MAMSLVYLGLVIFVAGVIGGVVNAITSDNGFFLPKLDPVADRQIWRPGFLGNMFVGGIAALVSWGLYGPHSQSILISTGSVVPEGQSFAMTLAAFVGAILIGIAGARWLTNELDKRLIKETAVQAAASPQDMMAAAKIATASPMEALKIACAIRNESPQSPAR